MNREEMRNYLELYPNWMMVQKSLRSGFYPRLSGRTTEILLNVLEVLPHRDVIVVGQTLASTEAMRENLYLMMTLLEIGGDRLIMGRQVPLNKNELRHFARGKNALLFEDHDRVNTDADQMDKLLEPVEFLSQIFYAPEGGVQLQGESQQIGAGAQVRILMSRTDSEQTAHLCQYPDEGYKGAVAFAWVPAEKLQVITYLNQLKTIEAEKV